MKTLLKKLFSVLVLCFCLATTVQAKILDLIQPFLGNSEIDVLAYHFNIQIPSLEADSIHIDLRLDVMPLVDAMEMELHTDTGLIDIKSISADGLPARFSYLKGIAGKPEYALRGDVLSIDNLPLVAGEKKQILISYDVKLADSKNQMGLFVKEKLGIKTLLSRNWPYYGRFWFPSNDTPLDSAKVSYEISVPVGYMAIANGSLRKQEGRSFYWEQDKPTSTYNFIFSVGQFSTYEEEICFNRIGIDNKRVDCAEAQVKIPLKVYYYPQISWHQEALQAIKENADSVIYFSKLFGQYEFEKLGFLISSYPFSMESTSLIVLNNKKSAVHEIAHHWFGNNVVIPHWGDFWVSEGFTTYVTGLYDEYLTGKNTSCFDETSPKALNSPDSTDPNDIFDSIPYCKGASALHDLRRELESLGKNSPLATEAFLKLLSQLYLDYRGKALSTEKFVEFVEKKSAEVYKSSGIELPSSELEIALDRWKRRWFVIQ